MKNEDVISNFVARASKIGHTRNLCARADGADLVNYGTVIARWIATGRTVEPLAALLVSSAKYSDTTSVLQNLAVGKAEKADIAVFRVPKLGGADMHTVNLAAFDLAAIDALNKLVKGRATSVDSYRRQAHAALTLGKRYAQTFGLTWEYSGPDPDAVKHASEEA